jgi:hypothetical protein
LSTTACSTGSFNIETSIGTSCGTNQNRLVLNHIRYHWDNYDSVQDYTGETLNRGMWEVVDTLNAFDNGYDNMQKNEPFNNSKGAIDNLDGRSPADFANNWNVWGTNSWTQLNNNCGTAGD